MTKFLSESDGDYSIPLHLELDYTMVHVGSGLKSAFNLSISNCGVCRWMRV